MTSTILLFTNFFLHLLAKNLLILGGFGGRFVVFHYLVKLD
jgi:hypothetical protein